MTLERESSHNEDIEIFIESQLQFDEDVDEDVLYEIRSEILNKSSGIFLWVNLAVQQLNQVHRRDGRMEAVRQRLREIPRAAKETYTSGSAMPLYGLFRDIIQKDDRNIEDLVRLIQIVFCAKRPLRPREMFVVLRQYFREPFDSSKLSDRVLRKHMLDVSKGLAEVTISEEPTVQFIHETVREFLRDGGLRIISQLSSQKLGAEGHETLKRSCLDQICAPVEAHLPVLVDYRSLIRYRNVRKYTAVTKEQQQKFTQQASAMFPFLEYASQNILFHANEAQATGTPQVMFLEHFPATRWIPIYNLFQKFNTKRYSANQTPILYILADHACNNLLELPLAVREGYAKPTTDEEFPSALACAVSSGNFDTVYALVGLDSKDCPQNIPARNKTTFRKSTSIMRMLHQARDPWLLRKVAADGNNDYGFQWSKDATSLEDLDMLVGSCVIPGFPGAAAGQRRQALHQNSLGPSTNLLFIREAINLDRNLLTAKVWNGKTMLDFAMQNNFLSLIELYLEYFHW